MESGEALFTRTPRGLADGEAPSFWTIASWCIIGMAARTERVRGDELRALRAVRNVRAAKQRN